MILTVTLNPAIDIVYKLDELKIDSTNRVLTTRKSAGGKGLNVARVIYQMKREVKATGFLGGDHGKLLKTKLDRESIDNDFYYVKDETRNCIAIIHQNSQTEVLEKGPIISIDEAQGFIDHFTNMINDVDLVVISGSLPQGLEADYYNKLVEICKNKNKKVIVDTSSKSLQEVLKVKPNVIKPNIDELSDILGRNVSTSIEDIKEALNNELFLGIDIIAVSLGGNGMFVKWNNKFFKVDIPKVVVKNAVGSGDSSVAGIAIGLSEGRDVEEVLKMSNTLGILNAIEEVTGKVNIENYDSIYENVLIREV